MCRSIGFGFDPVESMLAKGPFTFAKALAFAALRAELNEVSNDTPTSHKSTRPAPAAK